PAVALRSNATAPIREVVVLKGRCSGLGADPEISVSLLFGGSAGLVAQCFSCGSPCENRANSWGFSPGSFRMRHRIRQRRSESRSMNSPATACRGPLSEALFADLETVPLPETATLSRVILASYIIVSAARKIVGTEFPSSGYVA